MALVFVLLVGAAAASGAVESYVVDTLLLGVGAAGTAAAVVWGDAWGAVVTVVDQALGAADDRVNDLLFRQVFSKNKKKEACAKYASPVAEEYQAGVDARGACCSVRRAPFFFSRALFGI